MKTAAALALFVLLTACATPPAEPEKRSLTSTESLDIASANRAQANCFRGTMEDGRNFILCKNGVTGLPEFRTALRGPVDRSLTIESVANEYALAPRNFTGIKPATYSDLVLKDRIPAPRNTRPYDSVTVDGQTFDVYRVSLGQKVATVFIERSA